MLEHQQRETLAGCVGELPQFGPKRRRPLYRVACLFNSLQVGPRLYRSRALYTGTSVATSGGLYERVSSAALPNGPWPNALKTSGLKCRKSTL